jgi:TetR/AcrR family transcriptional regulator, cholesterol catabolism regulator
MVRNNPQRKVFIMQVARELIWEKGYDKTSMKDIAHACSFEPSNTYNYFHSKEHLLYEILREETGEMVSQLKQLETDETTSPVDQLRTIISSHIELTLGGRRPSGLTFDVSLKNLTPAHRKKIIALRDKYEGILRIVIRRGIKSGDFIEIDEKMLGVMIISMIVRSRIWFSPRGRMSRGEIADFILKLVLNGMSVRKDR